MDTNGIYLYIKGTHYWIIRQETGLVDVDILLY